MSICADQAILELKESSSLVRNVIIGMERNGTVSLSALLQAIASGDNFCEEDWRAVFQKIEYFLVHGSGDVVNDVSKLNVSFS